MLKNTTEQYGLISKTLHWLIAFMIVVLFAVGLIMTDLKDKDLQSTIYILHKASGFLLFVLVVFRILWIFVSPPPLSPAALAPTDRKIQKSVIGILYLLMIAVPVAGFLLSQYKGYGVDFFGLFQIPAFLDKSKQTGEFFEEAHEILAYSIMAVITLHVLGAIKHRIKDKGGETDVLKRML
ncbi:MAG: cytochrome b [bacterium]